MERDVRQPFRKTLDLDLPLEEIEAEADRLLHDGTDAYQPVQ
uniref:Uncharacterized protein n=1 Tax=Streptomyces sp. NBC_01401 TaxID=2903854 RepID=A0AAU3GND0_9ACTN